jgi:hypothetical protein
MSPVIARILLVGLSAPVLVLTTATAGTASSSTSGDDPLFGEGCRYVAVDTPTAVDPEAELCRPW